MLQEIPKTRLLKLALITSILFGMLGSVPFINTSSSFPQSPFIWKGFISLFILVLLQWIINILLLYSLFRSRSRWVSAARYVTSSAICILIFYAGFELLMKGLMPGMPVPPNGMRPGGMPVMRRPPGGLRFIFPLIQSLSINISILVILEFLMLDSRKQKVEKENSSLRIASLEARHGQLKQQLHPHFIFNSLNILKSLIHKSPGRAEEYLVQLSGLLRFSIYSSKKTMVHLKEELELARHYLSMQQLRFENALSVRIMLPPDMQQGFVPVYSIQLLIENAIKHNILTNNQPLEISITGDVENDTITVCNNIQTRLTVENGSGVGLSNLSERYQMMGNWPVLVKRENNLFKVTIKVLNDAGSDY